MSTTWRDQIAPIIADAVDSGKAAGLTGKALEKHVQAVRPHWCKGSYGYWPTKVWRDEFNAQVKGKRKVKAKPANFVLKGQGELFGSVSGVIVTDNDGEIDL